MEIIMINKIFTESNMKNERPIILDLFVVYYIYNKCNRRILWEKLYFVFSVLYRI